MKKQKKKAMPQVVCMILLAAILATACQVRKEDQNPAFHGTLGETEESDGDTDSMEGTSAVTGEEGEQTSGSPVQEEGLGKWAEAISAPAMDPDEYPAVDGSTATLPLSQALYQLVTGGTAQEAEAAIHHTKTTNAYRGLIHDYGGDLVLAYEPAPSVYDEMKTSGVSLKIKPIGKDALVFLANEGNPVRSLTGRQIRDIYSGRIRNWSEVGGRNKKIEAFQRPEGSGSQTLMDKLVMRGTAMDPDAPMTHRISEMGELIEMVSSYSNGENALGYSVYFYARNMYSYGNSKDPGLRFMAVDGVMPENNTIKDGSYPYVNEFYAAIREDEPEGSAAHILFDWLTTNDGQTLVESLGYVGIRDVEEKPVKEPEELKTVGDARIQFAEGEYFLLDGEFAYGTDGVLLMNEKMEVEEKIDGVLLPSRMEMVSLSSPVMLEDAETGKEGLYDLEHHRWVVQPHYWTLYYEESEDCYYGYQDTEFESIKKRIVLKGNEAIETVVPENIAGSHIWLLDHEKRNAKITDFDGNVVNEVNFDEYLDYRYGYFQQNYFIAYGEDGTFEVFDEQGRPLLNQSSMRNGRGYGIDAFSLDGSWFLGIWDTGGRFIYDMNLKEVATAPEDNIDSYFTDKESYYIVENQRGTAIYEACGKPFLSESGHPYEYAFGEGYFAYESDGKLIVEGGEPKRTYRLPVGKLDYGLYLGGDLFFLSAHGKTGSGIYWGENCLVEGRTSNWWHLDDYLILENEDRHTLVIDRESGAILYELEDGSSVIRPFDQFMAVSRGNYFIIMDYEGRYALKQLSGDMHSD